MSGATATAAGSALPPCSHPLHRDWLMARATLAIGRRHTTRSRLVDGTRHAHDWLMAHDTLTIAPGHCARQCAGALHQVPGAGDRRAALLHPSGVRAGTNEEADSAGHPHRRHQVRLRGPPPATHTPIAGWSITCGDVVTRM
eukprot:1188369-Prorocentrum_minimum.AAC.1